jgi:NOL1/NOP2/sun family putative RNA methylase
MQIPEHFADNMWNWLGAEWFQLKDALADMPLRAVRLHRLTTQSQPDAVPAETAYGVGHKSASIPDVLRAELLDPVPFAPDAFYISQDSWLGKSIYHQMGTFYIQEPSAMAVVTALNPQPGEAILDLCAAPGGKTTAIGASMRGTGTLVANEIHPSRVTVLAQNLERLGVPATVTNESPQRLATAFADYFDAVLVDAPCSGEGMFRKDPQAASEWTAEAPRTCATRQQHILEHAIQMVKPGGRIVYSTCTFNPFENEQVIAWALAHFDVEIMPLPDWPGWETGRPDWAGDEEALLHTRRLWPHKGRGEGHFVAALRVRQANRSGTLSTQKSVRTQIAKSWSRWVSEVCVNQVPDSWHSPTMVKDTLFASPTPNLPLQGLKVLRPGIALATVARERFVPHHNLATAIAVEQSRLHHELTAAQVVDYFSGHTLPAIANKGFTLLHAQNLPIGWAKSVADRLNNLYPKGLRKPGLLTHPPSNTES